MNAIAATRALNKRELETATPPSASWHADYRDTAYIYIGGLPTTLSEGDVTTIFSQYGNPTHLNLVREKDTGKSRGFAFLKYEDQRSCDLAVDNLGGAEVLGRVLRVDHSRYKKKDGEDEETWRIERLENEARGAVGGSDVDEDGERVRKKNRTTRAEKDLARLLIKQDGEEEDPMREYMIREKREEVENERKEDKDRDWERKSRHKRHHRRRESRDRDRNPDFDSDADTRSRRHTHRHHKDQDEDKESGNEHRSRKREDGSTDRRRNRNGDGDRAVKSHHGRESRGSKDQDRDIDEGRRSSHRDRKDDSERRRGDNNENEYRRQYDSESRSRSRSRSPRERVSSRRDRDENRDRDRDRRRNRE